MAKVMIAGYRCERCSHTWAPRDTTKGEPKVCPRCKSAWWNVKRPAKK